MSTTSEPIDQADTSVHDHNIDTSPLPSSSEPNDTNNSNSHSNSNSNSPTPKSPDGKSNGLDCPGGKRERPVLVLMEGSLLKLKHKPATFSSWKKRYFRVNPTDETLCYYESEKEVVPRKSYEVGHILKVHSIDNFTFQIIFRGSTETVLILRAPSSAEKMRWVHHLHLFVRELTAYANWLCLSNLTVEPEVKEFSGHLSKLKRTPTSFSTSWNKRFFRINTVDKTLEYYNKEPKEYIPIPNDRRVIPLGQVVEVRVLDPWTFQLEIQERTGSVLPENVTPDLKRVTSLQLTSGNKTFFCLQAKNTNEQNEWRSIIENYVSDLSKHRRIKNLEERALDNRRSVTFNAMEMELERVMNAATESRF